MTPVTPYDTEILSAIGVFFSIYILYFLIRIFADLMLVAIALFSAIAAFNIKSYYPEFRELLSNFRILDKFGVELTEQASTGSIVIIAAFIVVAGVVLSLPFLPFSQTYRLMLGIEKLTSREEDKIRQWVNDEAEELLEAEEAKVKQWVSEELERWEENDDDDDDDGEKPKNKQNG
jgi:signal transduction histidine kinase